MGQVYSTFLHKLTPKQSKMMSDNLVSYISLKKLFLEKILSLSENKTMSSD